MPRPHVPSRALCRPSRSSLRAAPRLRRAGRLAISALLGVVALSTGCGGFEIAQPFAGPGYDPQEGLLVDADGPFRAAATHLVLHDDADSREAFDRHMGEITPVLDELDGLVGYSLRANLTGPDRYTMTVWESEEAMVRWVGHEAHVAAMIEMAGKAEGTTTTWTLPAGEVPPSWEDALERLDVDGRAVY